MMEIKVNDKVRITAGFPEYIGQVGEVIELNSRCAFVKMPDGRKLCPWISGCCFRPECELVDEMCGRYHMSNLLDKKFVIRILNREKWYEVMQIMEDYGIRWWRGQPVVASLDKYSISNFFDYGISYGVIDTKKLMRVTCDYVMMKYNDVIDIPLVEFLNDNKKTNNMDNNVQGQIDALKRQIDELECSLKEPVYKVGDWVTCLPNHDSSVFKGLGYKGNKTFEITQIINKELFYSIGTGVLGVYSKYVRMATAEEIYKAPRMKVQKILTVGVCKQEAIVTATTITVLASGMYTPIKRQEIIDIINLMEGCKSVHGWKVTFDTCKIGCVEGIKLQELKDIIRTQDELNK